MIDFESPTDIQKKIERLREQRNKHHKDYLYGGSNVYWKAKEKVDKLDREISRLQQKKELIEKQQLALLWIKQNLYTD